MDADPFSILINIFILFILIMINAFFSASEIAIITLNDNKIRKMSEEGNIKASKVIKLTSNVSNFLSTIQVGVTLAGFLTSAVASLNFADLLTNFITEHLSINGPAAIATIKGFSVALITIIISYFSLVLGELLPKRLGMTKAESVSFKVVGTLLVIGKFFKPIIKFLTFSTDMFGKLLNVGTDINEEVVTEEEIMMMVDAGEEKGVIEESQREMINNVFEFDDINAGDVMRHRTEIEAVEENDNLSDVIKISVSEGYSRIPVYKEDLDDIVGIIYVKDLLPFVGKTIDEDSKAKEIMRPVHHVPESIKCGDLFAQMTAKHIHMVIVVDEYGGTAGLVTLEDLIETIVGNIQDEYDNEEEEIEKIAEGSFSIEGITDIEEVEEILGVKLPEGDYDTLGGMIMSILGRIPSEDEHPEVECSGFIFKVESVEERRIQRVQVEKIPEEEKAAAESPDET